MILSHRCVLILSLIFGFSSSFQLSLNRRIGQSSSLYGKLENNGDNTEPVFIPPEISRRAILFTSTIFTAGGILAGKPYASNAAASIYDQVKAIETANKIGMVGKPIYMPNTGPDPEKHLPQVKISEDRTVTVSVPHGVTTPENYIEFIWLKDANTDEVVLVKAFPPPTGDETGSTPPSLVAKVPAGVSLRPYAFCAANGLWKGETFTVN